ncbi:MAG: sigma-70 family RNA polymerase sigma factor [Planctomycetes bacterium]|nr:sigma-70 family RNA polymerase sigma factor [Planctomycetota bacterium]
MVARRFQRDPERPDRDDVVGRLRLRRDGEVARSKGEVRDDEASERSANEDRVWVERARCGDHSAFEKLVEKYQERAVWIARGLISDPEIARDVAQESFLRVYRSLDRYDPAHRFYTWFYRIVVHLAIDALRRRRRVVPWKLTGTPHGEFEYREVAGRAPSLVETRERVRRILERVPPKYRMLIVLRDFEGFTSKEIADIADWNHATVRWRLHRARQLFREEWESAGYSVEL